MQDTNVFVTNVLEVDQLVKCTALPVVQSDRAKSRARSGSVAVSSRSASGVAPLSSSVAAHPPLAPLSLASYASAVAAGPHFDTLLRFVVNGYQG